MQEVDVALGMEEFVVVVAVTELRYRQRARHIILDAEEVVIIALVRHILRQLYQ